MVSAAPHFHLRFTPTYNLWLNQGKCSFALIITQTVRHISFDSVAPPKQSWENSNPHSN
jgi:hypothetical protein